MRSLAASCIAAVCAAAAADALAECPKTGSPSRDVCKYSRALLVPSAMGRAYAPTGDAGGGPWLGGGLELILFTYSDNSDRFGPGQGKLFFDIGALASGDDADGTMIMYRGGVSLSIERNASRSWLIPYYGAAVGGLHERGLGRRGFVEATLGVHALYTSRVIVDVEGGYLFPFSDADALAGVTGQATVSVSLW